MSRPNIFIPANQQHTVRQAPKPTPAFVIIIENILTLITQGLVVATIGLIPLLFIFGNNLSVSFDRVLLSTILAGSTISFGAVLLLFKKRISSVFPVSLVFFLLFVVWGVFAAFAQGDSYDAVWGSEIEQLAVVFSALMLVFTILPLFLQSSTKMIIRAVSLIGVVAVLVLVHSVLKYWFGFSADFGELTSASQSLVGGFNDVAIYSGLIVLFGLSTLVFLPLRLYAQIAIAICMTLALSILVLVNFSLVWLVLLGVSAVTTLYVFLRKILFQNTTITPISTTTKIISLGTFGIALIASLYGTTIATTINEMTSTQFFEVRPSLEASIDITRETYEENLFLGVGPNRYADAWRLYKDTSINEGVFWNTDFRSGYSYIASVFTTHGLVGGLLLVVFHLLFIWFGVRRLLIVTNENIFARYITTVVFVGALFLWTMTYVYMPSVTLLLLAASLTGLTFATSSVLENTRIITVGVITNRIKGFVVLSLMSLVVVLTVWSVYGVFTKYNEQIHYVYAFESSNDEVIGLIANDRIADLNQLITTASPETLTQETLLEVSKTALNTSRKAVDLDPTNPVHYERLASLYSLLGMIGVEGGYASAKETLETVVDLDPKNPKHHLALARVQLAEGDIEASQNSIEEALKLKSNYIPALQLEVEIAIANETVSETISRVGNIAKLEPGNATRWYQLGLLHAAAEDTENAIATLLRAVRLDPSYADARYILALQYLAEERREEAVSQLRMIQQTNQNNVELQTLITNVENGEEIQLFEQTLTFNSRTPRVDSQSGVSVPSGVTSDLVAPVNTGVNEGDF